MHDRETLLNILQHAIDITEAGYGFVKLKPSVAKEIAALLAEPVNHTEGAHTDGD